MCRPASLLLRLSQRPAIRATQPRVLRPLCRWYSEAADQPLFRATAPAAGVGKKNKELQKPLKKLRAQISKDQGWEMRKKDGYEPEDAKLTSKGAIKEVAIPYAVVRLPYTNKTKDTDRLLHVHYIQLRDACTCELCVDPKTKQRHFRSSDIPTNIMPRRMRWLDESLVDEEKVLEVEWDTDVPGYGPSHVTRLSADEIAYPASHFYKQETILRDRVFWNKSDMDQAQHWVSYQDYMENDAKFHETLHALSRYGLIFIKDIPDSREMVEKLATRIGPLRNSFYGPTWDVRNDPKAKNVAYTNQNLGFHMDLLYMADPPGFQLLHCLKNSCNGGESLFVDAYSAARALDTQSWTTLTQVPVPYHYNHEDHYYRTTRPVIEVAQKSKDRSADEIVHINYSPPFQGPFDTRDLRQHWSARLKSFLPAFHKFAQEIEEPARIFELKLNPGECVIFENRRVLHARRAFDTTSGERWLAGAYIDESDVISKLFTMKRKAGVFNEIK